jgi:isocitrate dehydrogenase (NAD+)
MNLKLATQFGARTANLATVSRHGSVYTATMIPGDGVGGDMAASTRAVFAAARVPIIWDQYELSGRDGGDQGIFKAALASIKRNGVGLKGTLRTPRTSTSLNVRIRKELGLYASVVPVRSPVEEIAKRPGVDLIVVRENMEGEYAGLEHSPCDGVVESLKVVTRVQSELIARFAFDYALRHSRRRVTCVHKANIMKLGDGLFLETCQRIAAQYPRIAFDSMIVDNAAMQLVSNPAQFDVIVTGNLYGTVLTNVGAGLIGGSGVISGANYGPEYAVFEPGCRHTGRELAGKNIANPTATLLSGILMLRHLQLSEHASRVSAALETTLREGKVKTADLGGQASTTEFTESVIKNLK